MSEAFAIGLAVVAGILFLVIVFRVSMWLTDRKAHRLAAARGGAEGGYEAQGSYGKGGLDGGDAGGGDSGGGD